MNSITPPRRQQSRLANVPTGGSDTPGRVAIYARVSTGKQAEQELSIPDQIAQAEAWATQKGADVIARFIEPGASATDDRRPEFQRMIDAATSPDRPFDTVLVHSMSRFFRDQYLCEMYLRKLARAGVAVVSITQNFADDPTGQLIRKVVGIFDEYQSAENAKHTTRAMKENARQGFWNGSKPPFGYRAEAAGQRGAKIKKRLVIDEAEATVVRRIFGMALGREGPLMGVKAIVSRLNGEGVSFRGKPFQISNVHRLLTRRTYIGEHRFNLLHAKTGQSKPESEWVVASVPPIVDRADFDRVQQTLDARNPKKNPPQTLGGPTLLTGLVRCAHCGSGMTIRTGKSGRYRYYVCAGRAQKGETRCRGRSVAMEALDGMILEAMSDRLFTPDRLRVILESYISRTAEADSERQRRLGLAKKRQTEISGQINRLLDLVANGLMDPDDPSLAEKLRALKAQRAAVEQEIGLLASSTAGSRALITDAKIDRFARVMRQAMHNEDPAFRKAYLRMFVSEIVVETDTVSINGPSSALAKAVGQDQGPSTVVGAQIRREWRPVGDSNPCYRRERATS